MKNFGKLFSATLGMCLIMQGDCLAQKRQFNQSPFLPAREQAMVNRVQAGISAKANQTGDRGLFNQDCGGADKAAAAGGPKAAPASSIAARDGALNVGSFAERNRPREQIIVADAIINLGGHCRVRR